MSKLYRTFDVSKFKEIQLVTDKIRSVDLDLSRAYAAAVQIDNGIDVVENTIKVRKLMQKIKQKIDNIRKDCLNRKKDFQIKRGNFKCPNPDEAITCRCFNLRANFTCKNNKDCVICLDD